MDANLLKYLAIMVGFLWLLKRSYTRFFQNYSQQLIDYAFNDGIKLIFISPYAPHFGGMWEAGVKSCKYHLKQGLENSNMTYEDFGAVLT